MWAGELLYWPWGCSGSVGRLQRKNVIQIMTRAFQSPAMWTALAEAAMDRHMSRDR